MINEVISDIVEQRKRGQEEIVRQAFLRHFGFPIDQVLHDGDLTIETYQLSTVQRFCYKRECYLIWDESEGLNVETGTNYWRGTLTAKYLMI